MYINTCMLKLILLSTNIAVYLQKEGVKQAVEDMERVYGTKYNFGNHANTICKCIRRMEPSIILETMQILYVSV